MSETTAISGTRRQYKEMADGTLRVQIDIDPMFKQQFLELFGSIDMPVAIAPLKPDFEKPIVQEKKGGSLSYSAGYLCGLNDFQIFLKNAYKDSWVCRGPHEQRLSDLAARIVRDICKVASRAELDHSPEAAKRFSELMAEYREWFHGKAHNASVGGG
jgi:hypothetical protein